MDIINVVEVGTVEDLIECRRLIFESDEDLYIETHNKATGYTGQASFHTNGEDKIIVFEGDASGCDDASYTFDEFLSKYTYELKVEC